MPHFVLWKLKVPLAQRRHLQLHNIFRDIGHFRNICFTVEPQITILETFLLQKCPKGSSEDVREEEVLVSVMTGIGSLTRCEDECDKCV